MPMFRKKPVVIEAWQWQGQLAGQMAGVCQCDSNSVPHLHTAHENTVNDRGQLVFLTVGDWIIPEAKKEGRFYPCKPDVFAETYEPADAPQVIMDQLTDAILRGQGAVEIRHIPFAAELMPEQQKAFEEEWTNPDHPAGDTLTVEHVARGKAWMEGRDPGPAIGEHLTDIDAPEVPPGMPILPPGWSQDINTGMITDDHGQAQGIPLDWSRDATAEVNERYTRFRDELEHLINSFSMENGSDTPDFMLAAFMVDQLMAFDTLMQKRDGWYGGSHWKLKSQLEAEGAHTEAANAEIERLKQPNHTTEFLDPTSHPD